MEKAIEIIKQRIKNYQDRIDMIQDSEQSFVQSKHIRHLFDLIKENEAILKLLTEAV